MTTEEIAKVLAEHNMPDTFSLRYAFTLGMKYAAIPEECGYVPADTWCSVCICKGCGEACSEAGEVEPYPYCPYCARKIKPTEP